MTNENGVSSAPLNQFAKLYQTLKSPPSDTVLHSSLEKLGRLPKDFDGDYLMPHLQHPNHHIRYLAVKNMGKLADEKYIPCLLDMMQVESNSRIRRETISALGRMRSRTTIPHLFDFLQDADPEIVRTIAPASLPLKIPMRDKLLTPLLYFAIGQ